MTAEEFNFEERKQQTLRDADLLLMYGVPDTQFEPYEIVRLCMDDGRLERAMRMYYRDDPIEEAHYERLLEELLLNYQAGNINEKAYFFTKMKIAELKHRANPKVKRAYRVQHLKAKLRYYESQEEYETCAGIKAILEDMGVDTIL